MSLELFGCRPGPHNALMDVRGLGVGHATCEDGSGDSGVSVIVAPGGAVAGVDVRGGGPGTRETDLLNPENTVGAIHAVALCGGSAFGLDATSGVMAVLEKSGIGFPVLGASAPDKKIPIVSAAVIFDLLLGRWDSRPDMATGAHATRAALRALTLAEGNEADDQPYSSGNIGAGLGASAGALKGGFGQASAVFPASTLLAGTTVSAAVVVNPQGGVVNPANGVPWGVAAELEGEFAACPQNPLEEHVVERLRTMNLWGTKIAPEMVGVASDERETTPHSATNLNTTIGVVATDATLTKAQAKRLALAAHDGLARAIRPAHMPMDGDTLFGLSTGADTQPVNPVELSMLSAVGANCVERAIVHAVLAADSAWGVPSYRELIDHTSNTE